MTVEASNIAPETRTPLRDLAASLSDADRDRQVAHSTRRVVMASLGVLNDQKAVRKRTRSLVLAATLVVVLILGPLAWLAVDHFSSGGHLGDLTTEFSLWVCILCPAILAAALVAGWLRKR
ncbi:MAG TPA: hypothetical protein VG225_11715 [Terracidiphilus sp.]|jgi:hypothetical protein|nr:hypothetical protein [Terracidiphilus sp.]